MARGAARADRDRSAMIDRCMAGDRAVVIGCGMAVMMATVVRVAAAAGYVCAVDTLAG